MRLAKRRSSWRSRPPLTTKSEILTVAGFPYRAVVGDTDRVSTNPSHVALMGLDTEIPSVAPASPVGAAGAVMSEHQLPSLLASVEMPSDERVLAQVVVEELEVRRELQHLQAQILRTVAELIEQPERAIAAAKLARSVQAIDASVVRKVSAVITTMRELRDRRAFVDGGADEV